MVWIDHHKTSIEKWASTISGYRIDGVAACRLAWQWFSADHTDIIVQCGGLPGKGAFLARTVSEPLAVRLAGEYDIWDKRDPHAEALQYGLRCQEGELDWTNLLSKNLFPLEKILADGVVAQRYAWHTDASICNTRTWLMQWEGFCFLCVNSARFNSLLFAAKDIPQTGHEALLGFCFDGKCWTVSLYHAAHRKDIDLSDIAKRYGGGGHRGACGFTCAKLPFQTEKAP